MKKLMFIIFASIILACSTTQSIKYDSHNESDLKNNFPILDSIYVDSEYKPVGKIEEVKFSSMFSDYPFPIERYPLEYPILAINDRIEGFVILQVEISANGLVKQVLVNKSVMSGQCVLGEAAVKSVKKWKFSPAKKDGKPVACWTTFPVEFRLK